MRRYRVYYVGAPNEGLMLNASSWGEAAFLFFSNEPEKRTIFVGRTALFEREVPYERLRALYPQADEMLAKFAHETGVIADTLKHDYAMVGLEDDGWKRPAWTASLWLGLAGCWMVLWLSGKQLYALVLSLIYAYIAFWEFRQRGVFVLGREDQGDSASALEPNKSLEATPGQRPPPAPKRSSGAPQL